MGPLLGCLSELCVETDVTTKANLPLPTALPTKGELVARPRAERRRQKQAALEADQAAPQARQADLGLPNADTLPAKIRKKRRKPW